jgi:glycine/D-amino acid oxidase-like deaminating enzyme
MTDLYKLFDIKDQTESLQTNKKTIESFFPIVKNYEIKNSWRGLMPFSPDGEPITGKIDCVPGNLYINTGLASAGIMKGFGTG